MRRCEEQVFAIARVTRGSPSGCTNRRGSIHHDQQTFPRGHWADNRVGRARLPAVPSPRYPRLRRQRGDRGFAGAKRQLFRAGRLPPARPRPSPTPSAIPAAGWTPLWTGVSLGQGVIVSQGGLVDSPPRHPRSSIFQYPRYRGETSPATRSCGCCRAPRERLYFSSGSPDQQLFVKNFLNDLDAVQLTTGPGLITGFDVDPAAGMIILSRRVPPNSDLFRMNLDGTGLTPLTDGRCLNQFPAIHSATNELYFSRRAPGATVTQIWRMATDGSDLIQITTGTQDKILPGVPPDGQRLAGVETFPGFNNEIMTADISGADPVRLTDRSGDGHQSLLGHRIQARVGCSSGR